VPIEFGYPTLPSFIETTTVAAPPAILQIRVDRLAGRAPHAANGKIANAVKVARQGSSRVFVMPLTLPIRNTCKTGRWVNLGLVDEVIVQVYRQDLAALKVELYNGVSAFAASDCAN